MKLILSVLVLLVLCACLPLPYPNERILIKGSFFGVKVKENKIVDGEGKEVMLIGVNRSGSEYMCAQGRGIFEGPTDKNAILAMKSWGVNIVRITLNETCWLGINGVNKDFSGKSYRGQIRSFVNRLLENKIVPILTLHLAAPGKQIALGQTPMPNADHSADFWKSVAGVFKNENVLFDLYNETYPDKMKDTHNAWRCWKYGGYCSGFDYKAIGMQDLINVVRKTGAKNIILIGGVGFANSLSKFNEYKVIDPIGNLAISFHMYDFNRCDDIDCIEKEVVPVNETLPIIITEIGEGDCNDRFIKNLLVYFDSKKWGHLGWAWDVWNNCYGMISDYNGTPRGSYGKRFKEHFGGHK